MSKINERRRIKIKKIEWLNFRSILKFLEDPEHPSVGPHLRLLSLTGQWHPNRSALSSRLKMITFYVTVLFFFSQYAKCLIKANISCILLILQYAPFHMGVLKTCFFQKDYNNWEELIGFMSSTERRQLSEGDGQVMRHVMDAYIRRGRRVTYFFWTLAFISNISIFTEPYQKNQIVENGTDIYFKLFDFAAPFDQEVPPGYYVSMGLQTVLGNVMSAYVVAWDTLVVTTMIFFAGQLQISRIYCTKVIISSSVAQSHSNIVACHNFHISLVKHHKLFNKLISSVMCVYLVVVSVNLGVLIIQISTLKDLAALVASVVFVVACLIQLLIFYWYGSEVTEKSTLVNYGLFESDFVKMNPNILKEVNLLQLATSKRLVFRAGPFNEMSLSTFVAILRSSYSFYTLLNETN